MTNKKIWNWQSGDWPNFSWDHKPLQELEECFLYQSGLLLGIYEHIDDKSQLNIEIISNEAYKTSEIEGELLNRDSLQSSIRRNFGLAVPNAKKSSPAESGIAEMMVDLYKNFDHPLSEKIICNWHGMLMNGRRDISIASYRTHEDAMQVISGPIGKTRVHFEAPPSKSMNKEMKVFIKWFNQTAPKKSNALPALIRASITHLYFVCIHPFEDGNGRLARALAEKSLAQSLGHPTLIALSQTIQKHRKEYYDHLENNNKECEITNWIIYFAKTILEAQNNTIELIQFIIKKTKFYDKIKNELNERQLKVISRILEEGIEGFKGGLSAKNYKAITQTSLSTVTRDLQDLIRKNVMFSTGARKGTRYYLKIDC